MSQRKMRGFSLLEMMAVIAIGLIAAGMAVVTFQPTIRAIRVANGYNTTLMALRQARDTAIGQRQTYVVTFSHNATPPDTVVITQGATGAVVSTYGLPRDVSFTALTGLPGAGKTPDNFGSGGVAIDFDQGVTGGTPNVIYFYPDGTAQDVNGNINNGVVYVTESPYLYMTHAITVWGATGRLRGWRLYSNSSSPYWRQM